MEGTTITIIVVPARHAVQEISGAQGKPGIFLAGGGNAALMIGVQQARNNIWSFWNGDATVSAGKSEPMAHPVVRKIAECVSTGSPMTNTSMTHGLNIQIYWTTIAKVCGEPAG